MISATTKMIVPMTALSTAGVRVGGGTTLSGGFIALTRSLELRALARSS
jgi:hypothetical protein